jgi:hypothetical protein
VKRGSRKWRSLLTFNPGRGIVACGVRLDLDTTNQASADEEVLALGSQLPQLWAVAARFLSPLSHRLLFMFLNT